jgi:hypothetical protein
LNIVQLDGFYARLLRPGFGTLLKGPSPQSRPTCSASTGTATSSTGTIVTTVFYPAGDSKCGKSPTRILVVEYVGQVGGTATAFGYQIAYAQANDPTVPVGTMIDFEQFEAVLYNASSGHASIQVADSQSMSTGDAAYPASPPAAGVFPATFPVGLPSPVTNGASSSFATAYFAVNESGSTSRAGTSNLGSYYTNPFAVITALQNVGVDVGGVFDVGVSAPRAGSVDLSWSASQLGYEVDPLPDEPRSPTPFPLGQGNSAWPLPALGSLGLATSQLNFPTSVTGSATYSADGTLLACRHSVTDSANAVSTTATCSKGGAEIDLAVTDLHASASATTPAKIVVDSFGNGVGAGLTSAYSYTVLFDGSRDQISAFGILPAL